MLDWSHRPWWQRWRYHTHLWLVRHLPGAARRNAVAKQAFHAAFAAGPDESIPTAYVPAGMDVVDRRAHVAAFIDGELARNRTLELPGERRLGVFIRHQHGDPDGTRTRCHVAKIMDWNSARVAVVLADLDTWPSDVPAAVEIPRLRPRAHR